ncbi:MAG: Asparagine synthetase (glutamine-hydrolyzing) 1 [Syntrophus sp. PtaU1.Bin208]|nr:MAG: Asparagine synthetase (glutamine-hydrolyzing) 1 [Syntrophus sp. PtaU1.Bin208]
MCGICGIYNYGSHEPVVIDCLQTMNDTLRHRGPNDEGRHIDGDLGLAMRRLSIIDIGGGKQPIHNEDRTIWIVFNGEIFNYPELKRNLEGKGHTFYTQSDTETIVHLYEQYGDDCVNFLRGMFAFALWDGRSRSLLLARDRVGIKPLFYSDTGKGELLFASEPKALLASPKVSREMDFQGLDAYFAYGYIPAPLSIYKSIRKLPAGHIMKISQSGLSIRKYWDLYFRPEHGKPQSYFENKFEEIFSEAVKMRMISEVPLGAFLSGGVDSGLVVAYMADAMNSAPHTFSVGFSGNVGGYLDERPYARMIAERYRCQHRELIIEPRVEAILDDIVDSFDEPFADDSVIPSYYICEASSRELTVALTGLGGDELFAGYERYLGLRISLLYDYLPSVLSNGILAPIIDRLPELRNGHYTINHLKRFVRASHLPLPERYASYLTMLNPEQRACLYHPDIAALIDFRATEELMTGYFRSDDNALDPLDKMFYQDIKTYLPDDILALTDRIGMRHSMELRVPFTDHVLMEFCATIPAEMKIKRMRKKAMLKSIAAAKLPQTVLNHRKQGFASPMAQWLKNDLKSFIDDLLSGGGKINDGILRKSEIRVMIADHMQGRELNDKRIFALIMFQRWCERSSVFTC